MMGHGKPSLTTVKVETKMEEPLPTSTADEATQDIMKDASQIGQEATRCARQARRLQEIVHRLRRKAADYPVNEHHGDAPWEFRQQDKETLATIHDELNDEAAYTIKKNV